MSKLIDLQSLALQNRLSETGRLSDFLASYAKKFQLPAEVYNDLRLVLEEAFVNIVNYAFVKGDIQMINIDISNAAGMISITFSDEGIAFDPLSDPAECLSTKDHSDGGMGIHIIKSLTDHQHYRRVGQSNVFTVTKHYTY